MQKKNDVAPTLEKLEVEHKGVMAESNGGGFGNSEWSSRPLSQNHFGGFGQQLCERLGRSSRQHFHFRTMRMRTRFATLAAAAVVALLAACSNDDENIQDHDGLITITASLGTANQAGTDLPPAGSDPLAAVGTMSIKWAAPVGNATDDAFMLYGSDGGKYFTLTSVNETGTIGQFRGKEPGVCGEYKAFWPAKKAADANGNPLAYANCLFDMTGQTQVGPNSTAHLADYHYMTAASSNYNSLTFNSHVAVLEFEVTLPAGEIPTELAFECSDIKLSQKADGNDVVTGNRLALGLSGINAPSFTAYLAILPFTIPEGAGYAVTITTANGGAYEYVSSSTATQTFEPEVVYNMGLTATAGTPANHQTLSKVSYLWDDTLTEGSNRLLGAGTEADPFQIRHAADLKCFMENHCCSDDDVDEELEEKTTGCYYKLMHDIKIGLTVWEPRIFFGNFDGGGCIISGRLGGTSQLAGFFGGLDFSATASNLIVSATVSAKEGIFVGGICGANSGHISNCTYSGTITGDDASFTIGGICGASMGVVSDCTNSGAITGDDYACGGICGYNMGGQISNCINSGAITGDGECLSGICGANFGQISHCTNSGSITGTGTTITGGICALNAEQVSDCINSGAITGFIAGGICGSSIKEISGCKHIQGVITSQGTAGGICGILADGIISHCINSSPDAITEVNSDDDTMGGVMIGGICGIADKSAVIAGCSNTGTGRISSSMLAGGICGGNLGKVYDSNNTNTHIAISGNSSPESYKGSLVGYCEGGHVYNCCNGVTAEGLALIGGPDDYVLEVCDAPDNGDLHPRTHTHITLNAHNALNGSTRSLLRSAPLPASMQQEWQKVNIEPLRANLNEILRRLNNMEIKPAMR